jgi:hypothetical protein
VPLPYRSGEPRIRKQGSVPRAQASTVGVKDRAESSGGLRRRRWGVWWVKGEVGLELGKAEGRGEACEGLQTAEGGTHPASWQHLGRGVSRPSPNPTQLAWALTQGQGLRCRGAFEAGVGARQDSTAGSLA